MFDLINEEKVEFDGRSKTIPKPHTYWTGKGFVFIRELLKVDGLI